MAPMDSPERQETITLNTGEMFDSYQLHVRCANQFRAELKSWITRSILNPPLF